MKYQIYFRAYHEIIVDADDPREAEKLAIEELERNNGAHVKAWDWELHETYCNETGYDDFYS